MLTAVADVHYPRSGGASAALVLLDDLRWSSVAGERVVRLDGVADYRPGAFYLRELPALRAVLDGVGGVTMLVVDGYVDLAPGRPGLGAHAHDAFGVPVVGVAKTAFRGATHAVAVVRGQARNPLHVTAAGLPLDDAAALVRDAAGPYRLPDAVRRADAWRAARPGRPGHGMGRHARADVVRFTVTGSRPGARG